MRACQRIFGEIGGITSAVVLPISSETGTNSYPLARSVVISSGSAATVAERLPPPSCSRMMLPLHPRAGLHLIQLRSTLSVISCGDLRGCSFQSSVSILSPMMV